MNFIIWQHRISLQLTLKCLTQMAIFFFFNLILLYNTVLVLPYINMNPPSHKSNTKELKIKKIASPGKIIMQHILSSMPYWIEKYFYNWHIFIYIVSFKTQNKTMREQYYSTYRQRTYDYGTPNNLNVTDIKYQSILFCFLHAVTEFPNIR